MSLSFEWLYGNNWIPCDEACNKVLTDRRKSPTMIPLKIKTDFGELWGVPEDEAMGFKFHGDDDIMTTRIRISAKDDESPLYTILCPEAMTVLDYEASVALFKNGAPSHERVEYKYGTYDFVASNGELYERIHDHLEPRRWKHADLTRGEFEDMTQTRFKWKFKGPLRWPRMCKATLLLIESMSQDPDVPEEKVERLRELFENFDPEEDNTDYGPIQFPDFLNENGMQDFAFKLVELYKAQEVGDWSYFDTLTNHRIEQARQQDRPVVIIPAHGQKYMIIFDTGGGASGQSAALIRPTRYQKILESIEEQFYEAEADYQKQYREQLVEILHRHSISPRMFIMSMVTSQTALLDRLPEPSRTTVSGLLEKMRTSNGTLSSRIQRFLPALLEKFKEGDIKMDEEERLNEKPLCPELVKSIRTGLGTKDHDFKDIVQFIHKTQSWCLPKGRNTCDICGARSQTTLSHCGTAAACLKCWTDSLVKSNMSCPFCRGTVEGKCLKRKKYIPAKTKGKCGKRKRPAADTLYFDRPQDVLAEIHKDEKYKDITQDTIKPMRKWFTILLRRKLVPITQMPRNEQGKKDFKEAMKTFKLLR